MHPKAYEKAETYRLQLAGNNKLLPGARLLNILEGKNIVRMNTEQFIEQLVATKPPMIFAESEVYGNGIDWNQNELSILGDIGIAVPVTIFDNGKHVSPGIHFPFLQGTLLYIPGALLRNGKNNTPADWNEVVKENEIDPIAYQVLYERRLLPLLFYANVNAKKENHKALITIPGIGCGQFAGPFRGKMGIYLKDAIIALLNKYAAQLPHIKIVYYDPYSECENEQLIFEHLSLRIRPLRNGNEKKHQLCSPCDYQENESEDFNDYRLYSIVAWDHVSWPGNDFYAGSRSTDDGVKAAATNSMGIMTGIKGEYNVETFKYEPPINYRDWLNVVSDKKLTIKVENNLLVLPC
jgi:hypothetical protein